MATTVRQKISELYKWRAEMVEEFYYNDSLYTEEFMRKSMKSINSRIKQVEKLQMQGIKILTTL